jgi:phenol hydroxylase P5 protein
MSYELTIEPIGQTIEVEDDQTILDAALRAWHLASPRLLSRPLRDLQGDRDRRRSRPRRRIQLALMDFERRGQNPTCCARLQSDVTIEAEIDEDPDAESIPVRDFPGTVSRIETLTPTIKAIFIELDEAIFRLANTSTSTFPA